LPTVAPTETKEKHVLMLLACSEETIFLNTRVIAKNAMIQVQQI